MAEAKAAAGYLTEEQQQALETEVNQFCDAAAQKRRPKEVVWALARKMVAGEQWLRAGADPAATQQILDEVKLPGRMEKWKITANRLLPGLDTRLAHVLKNKPIGVVTPETQDEEDRNAARIADEVVEYDLRTLDWQGKMAEWAGPETFTTGLCYLHWYWNPLAGPNVDIPQYLTDEMGEVVVEPMEVEGVDPVTFQPAMVPNESETAGKPIQIGVLSVPRGEPALEVVEAEEIYLDPAAKKFDDCEALCRQTLRPVDETKRLMAKAGVDEELIEKIDKLDGTDGWGAQAIASARLSGYTQTDIASRCEVRVFWAKPNESKGWPNGLRAVFVNRKLMLAEPTPDGSDHVPFAMLLERPVPGDIYPTSSVIQAMPIQKALNLTISRDEYRRTVQRPKLVADHEAGIDETAWTSEDSEIVFKNHGYSVNWEDAPTYASDERAVDRYIAFIDDLFGNVAILMGEADGEVRSGRQAFIQGEYAGVSLSGPARSIERCLQRVGRGLLRLRKANTAEDRDIQIVGKNRGIEVMHFRGSDLDGAGDYYVEPGSALPMSTAQKKQMIFEMVDRMMISPDRALRLLPVPSDIDAEMDEERLDRDRATEENMLFAALTEESVLAAIDTVEANNAMDPAAAMAQMADPEARDKEVLEELGIEPRPDFENNEVHWREHAKWRKGRQYRALPKVVKAFIDLHCDLHLPPPPMPGEEPKDKKGGKGKMTGENGAATPQGLAPGMPPRVGNVGERADMAGDVAGGLPPMPPTPSAAG